MRKIPGPDNPCVPLERSERLTRKISIRQSRIKAVDNNIVTRNFFTVCSVTYLTSVQHNTLPHAIANPVYKFTSFQAREKAAGFRGREVEIAD